ncbi:MAG: MBOAT family protein, partial [Propionibacteriaceae bacterium]|nr:MBOAT family protein [Propionibacteriaceae bacterium]
MLFSSVTFLYYFLPAALLAYHLTPRPGGSQRWRNLVLLVASLVFYAWGEPRHVVVMLGEIAVVWALGLVVDKARGRPWAKVALVASLVVGLGALVCFKYADFLIANVDAALKSLGVGSGLALIHLALPLGISFYTFQMLSYSIDLYRGKVALQRNPLDFACYVTA